MGYAFTVSGCKPAGGCWSFRNRACAKRNLKPGAGSLSQSGFTLVEMIMVMVITGIIAGVVAVFMQKPLVAYFDASSRAALTDAADLALRAIRRDLRQALPNSVRVTAGGAGNQALELVPTLAAGRYDENSAASCFAGGCSGLTTLGSLGKPNNYFLGKSLVIFNYYNNSAGNCAASTLPSVYCGQNAAAIGGSTTGSQQDTYSFANTRFYPAGGSPQSRFQVADSPVSYVCPASSGGNLLKYWGYATQAVQSAAPSGGNSAILAGGVTVCQLSYQSATGFLQRMGIVSIRLTLAGGNESVSLYEEVHVNDAP